MPSWAYGITTVPERQYNYFPTTLNSLEKAGFVSPTIFVDGSDGEYKDYGLPVVHRSSRIRALGHWLLALMELWIRYPKVERYALFQDDLLMYKNLKAYLDQCVLPPDTYWNLYTFPENETLCRNRRGWFYSNQRGRGAVALIFSAPVVYKILTAQQMIDKPRCPTNPFRSIDGAIVNSLAPRGVKEMTHYPTLTQHQGDCSSIGNVQHTKPQSWLGEQYDALQFTTELIPS